MSDTDPASFDARDRSANVTLSRTWELELFISGATVFALLQAPAVVDGWWARTDPQLAGTSNMAGFFAYYYAKLILYSLIATFIIHLVTRAYWVGLVGLHSVYPAGVQWNELKLGPAFQQIYRARLPSLEASIRKVDDLSSLLFSGGAIVLLMFLLSVALVAALGSVAFLLCSLLFGMENLVTTMFVLVAVLALVPAIARMVDAAHGRRNPDAAPRPFMLRLARLSYFSTFTAVVGPLSLVMASNLGRRTAGFALGFVFFAIIGTFTVRDVLISNDVLRADSHAYLPDQWPAQYANPAYYADRRDDGDVHATLPAIQSEIIRDPYVRLFVPLVPDRHNAVIAERCPDLPRYGSGLRMVSPRSAAPEPPDVAPLLACLAELQPVSIDGVRLTSISYRITADQASGVKGLVAFIPVAGLQPGEHVLRVEGMPRPSPDAGRDPRPARPPFLIPFWL